jgi:hypothetical protein
MSASHDFEELRERMQQVIARSASLHAESVKVLNDSSRRLEESVHLRAERDRPGGASAGADAPDADS